MQEALPEILRVGRAIRSKITERTRGNLEALRSAIDPFPAIETLPVEGGWSAVLRVPRLRSDEDLVLELLERRDVFVHPGYFFDFQSDGFVVLSLLTPADVFREGVRRIVEYVGT